MKQINFPYEIAKRLGKDVGPFAAIGDPAGLYVGYYLNEKLYGSPASSDPEGVALEMKNAKIGTLIVFSSSKEISPLKGLLESGKFERRLRIDGVSFGYYKDVDVLSLKEN